MLADGEEIAPVQRKLEQFPPLLGLVFGAFAEGSEGVHKLVKVLADTRLKRQGAARGREGSQQELAIITGQIRRLLSMAVVRANATCLLSRINQVGEGAALASKRREISRIQEDRMRLDRQAQWLCKIRRRAIVRRGKFFLN